jgi:hypothetical protein
MNKNEIETSTQYLNILTGSNLVSVGRASSLAWFLFVKDDDEFALHLQTGFRVIIDDDIYFTGADIFQPSDALENSDDFDYQEFYWDEQGNNRYDEKVSSFKDRYALRLQVTDTAVNQFGDLSITLTESVRLEVYITQSKEECWRFFKRHTDDHLVMTGSGLEKDE